MMMLLLQRIMWVSQTKGFIMWDELFAMKLNIPILKNHSMSNISFYKYFDDSWSTFFKSNEKKKKKLRTLKVHHWISLNFQQLLNEISRVKIGCFHKRPNDGAESALCSNVSTGPVDIYEVNHTQCDLLVAQIDNPLHKSMKMKPFCSIPASPMHVYYES